MTQNGIKCLLYFVQTVTLKSLTFAVVFMHFLSNIKQNSYKIEK